MKAAVYGMIQWTWGLVQTLAGFALFLLHFRERHYRFHGAVVTEWSKRSSISLGMFVFITGDPFIFGNLVEAHAPEELFGMLCVHEYGHTIQSLILGPLYLPVIGLPSVLWAMLPGPGRKRREKRISYFAFYPERWANHLGELTTKEHSMGMLVID